MTGIGCTPSRAALKQAGRRQERTGGLVASRLYLD